MRTGVLPGSWFHQTECSGPVLGVMRARSLDEALAFQNGVRFGLTAGLHSLDPGEIAAWCDRAEAGNLYVNRSTTGAVVRRQPFGGWRASAVGPTAKAGGPNYVARLMDWPDASATPVADAAEGFRTWMRDAGRAEADPSGLAAEANVFRYRPLPGGVLVRAGVDASGRAVGIARAAADAARCRVVVSRAADEDDAAAAARVRASGADRVRLIGGGHVAVRAAAHAAAIPVDAAPPVALAAVEMPRWLHEQAVSVTRHRHGHLPRAFPSGRL